MRRFIDCQLAVVSWGDRAKFKRARVGLIRKGSTIYIATFFNLNDSNKFPLKADCVELLPAAIRFKELEKDLFIRQISDEQRYAIMLREIKVILKRDKLKQAGKSDAFDKFIHSIPQISTLKSSDLIPARLSARLIVERPIDGYIDDDTGCGYPPYAIDDVGHNYLQKSASDEIVSSSRNTIASIGAQQLRNKQLKLVKISGLDRLPEQLWTRDSLNELTLTNCNLTSVPKQLENFSGTLKFLDLANNSINKLPRTFCCKMNNLRFLSLSNNSIETLPIEIKFFSRLVDLDLSDNKLRMLPSTFSDLKRLRNLNVANNNLSQLPAFRKEDIRLSQLDVSHNPLDGAMNEANTYEVHSSFDEPLGYNENLISPSMTPFRNDSLSKKRVPRLFEIAMLRIVRCDRLLKMASEESLPKTIVSTMQRDIFKCYKCSLMSILPAYNSTDILDYVDQVEVLKSTGNYRHGMTFMKLLCRGCFDNMSS